MVGLGEAVYCQRCTTETALTLEFWQERFGRDAFAEAIGFSEGEGREINMFGGSLGGGTYAYGNRMPRCQKCKEFSPSVEQLAAAVPQNGLTCPSCQNHIRVREADAFVHNVLPEAKYVVHEGAIGKGGGEGKGGTQPVVFQCMQCAGAMKVDGSSRMVTCSYCNTPNYLPDGLWLRLHPVQKIEVFFIVASFARDQMRRLKYVDEDARRADAAVAGLPQESYELFARDEESDVRKALAGNPDAPTDVLVSLVGDSDWDVRAALAGNPSCPPEQLVTLAGDSDSDVREAVVGNASLSREVALKLCANADDDIARKLIASPMGQSPEVVEALVSSTNWKVRQTLARSPALSEEQLRRLARDSDSDVRQTAENHPQWREVKPMISAPMWIFIVGLLFSFGLWVYLIKVL